ncbi:hypothetical protein [Ammoniphilus resinae]|uniref:Uncharacterized protein n=1 Tax=Ammoniphilus resinae TaxID=861532 RepID=A0ABS4GRB5_9BACL|nr:hypothetical protein [Ammoniphilus resinae]MBP1932822.1 hypothetical protein [Ammoniphilus resinae]
MNRWLILCCLLGVLAFPLMGQAETWEDSFEKQIKQWTQELAAHDQRFTAFADAEWEQQALGPNSRQWLVTFLSQNKKLGYMIIEDGGQGFALLEYGLGEYTLFEQPLLESLRVDPNKTIYAGLESVWDINDRLFDAKSGEQYPAESRVLAKEIPSDVEKGASLEKSFHLENVGNGAEFSWVYPSESVEGKEMVMKEIEDSNLTLLAYLFEETVRAPFPIVGYHLWDKDLFLELDDYGSRYVSYRYAMEIGDIF